MLVRHKDSQMTVKLLKHTEDPELLQNMNTVQMQQQQQILLLQNQNQLLKQQNQAQSTGNDKVSIDILEISGMTREIR